MKKTIIGLAFFILLLTSAFSSMSFKSKNTSESKIVIPIPDIESSTKPKKKIRWRLKHDGFLSQCGNCACALGICSTFGISDASSPLSQSEILISNELGLGDSWVIDNGTKMVISFDQTTAYQNPNNATNKIVEIPSNYLMPASIAIGMGYNSVTIISGTYFAIFETGLPNGYIIVNVTSN